MSVYFLHLPSAIPVCIIILASVSVVSTLLDTRANLTRISHMARFECQISVRGSSNDGDGWLRMSSSQLIPGDIVSIENDMLMPCDCALLDGACVVNEASLTGESVPVVKVAQNLSGRNDTDRVSLLNSASTALHTLFASTRVLQVKPRGGSGGGNAAQPRVLAVVTRTGFDTAKGDLIISILFPRPSFFRFIQQSHRFIGALFVLALIGFFVTVWKLSSVGAPVSLVILRALDLMTTVVPPTLPLSMSVGINVATRWLARIGVFCTSPGRIAMAGKVVFRMHIVA